MVTKPLASAAALCISDQMFGIYVSD